MSIHQAFPWTYRSPSNTLYTWDISHAFAALYHPYTHKPVALTECLKHKLWEQCAKQQSHSHPTQVKSNIPLECNINSDLSTLATTNLECLDRRGEWNIPKQYLINAEWVKDRPIESGYYVGDPDCYVLVEHSARCEPGGYDSDALHVVLEACTSDTLWELLVHWHMDGTGLQGCGRYPRHTRCSGGICMFRT